MNFSADALHAISARITHQVDSVAIVPSTCVPPSTVLLSVANTHHRPLRHMQFQTVRGLWCLLSRVVTLCAGFEDGEFGLCVPVPNFQPSDFQRNSYLDAIWLKWVLLAAALSSNNCKQAVWIDADVLLLGNPFRALPPVPNYTLAYQSETTCTGCTSTCQPNSGVLHARDRSLIEAILAARNTSASRSNALDQHVARQVLDTRRGQNMGGRFCSLGRRFMGHCWFGAMHWHGQVAPSSAEKRALLCNAVTFHACGAIPSNARQKLALMNSTLHELATYCRAGAQVHHESRLIV